MKGSKGLEEKKDYNEKKQPKNCGPSTAARCARVGVARTTPVFVWPERWAISPSRTTVWWPPRRPEVTSGGHQTEQTVMAGWGRCWHGRCVLLSVVDCPPLGVESSGYMEPRKLHVTEFFGLVQIFCGVYGGSSVHRGIFRFLKG